MLDRLRGFAERGSGVVVVLHDLSHAARVADDAMLLRDGRLLAFGTAASVLQPAQLEQVYGVSFERVALETGAALIPRPGRCAGSTAPPS